MTRQQFIDTFVATWLANYASAHYEEACNPGDYKKVDNPPAEEANPLGFKAWCAYKDSLEAKTGVYSGDPDHS
jgi:hypothetical protein